MSHDDELDQKLIDLCVVSKTRRRLKWPCEVRWCLAWYARVQCARGDTLSLMVYG